MALPVIADVFRCAVSYELADRQMANVIHISASSTVTSEAVGDAVAGAWGETASLCALQSSTVTLESVHVTKLDGASLSVDRGFGVAAHSVGTGSSAAVPATVCGILTFHTGARGRSHRGRMYLGGVTDDLMDFPATRWSSSWPTSAATAYDTFATFLDGFSPSLQQVVASYKLAEAFPITTLIPQTYFGTIRGRNAN